MDHDVLSSDNKAQDERRRHQRQSVEAEVLVKPTERTDEPFWARALNVSYGGMFLDTTIELPLYTELETQIVPEGTPAFRARARVMRSLPGRGVGCCFSHLTAQARLYLSLWLGRTGGLPLVTGVIQSKPSA